MKAKYALLFLLAFFISSCIYEDAPEVLWNEAKYDPHVIIKSNNHLAFPDLINYNDTWYVTYRESDAHIHGSFSKIIVLKSKDFINWEQCNVYEKVGWDLRDPKFSYNEITDSLFLHIHSTNEIGTERMGYGTIRKNQYFVFNKNYNRFEVNEGELKSTDEYKNYWLWRPYWYNNNLYVSAYRSGNNLFYKYDNINKEPIIIGKMNGEAINETTFRVYNNKLYFIARRNNEDALFGSLNENLDSLKNIKTSTFIPFEYNILKIGQLGGPNMVIHDSIAYIGGRSELSSIDRTIIYKYSILSKEIDILVVLESYGDNSYPGMVLIDNTIYGIYYTQNNNYNGYEIKGFKIPLK